jgi:hypothetical protein
MTTTPENQARSWHDLADQLTTAQIARLEELERTYHADALLPKPWWSTAPRADSEIARTLVDFARMYAAENLHDVLFAGVALPAMAVSAYPWQPEGIRVFRGEERQIEERIRVWAHGIQHADGRIDDGTLDEAPGISVDGLHWEDGISSETARRLIDLLVTAVDEVDGWSAR